MSTPRCPSTAQIPVDLKVDMMRHQGPPSSSSSSSCPFCGLCPGGGSLFTLPRGGGHYSLPSQRRRGVFGMQG